MKPFHCLFAWFVAALFSVSAAAQGPGPQTRAAQPATVMVATGDIDSTEARIVSELARALGDGSGLRIIPIVGQGSVQNVSDLLSLRNADAAVIQYDVLSQFRRSQRIPLIQNKLQYIAKLYSQEVHVLARMQFSCLADLNGRTVNFGPKGSGAALTAENIFNAHGVGPQPTYLDHSEALRKLKSGEIDAAVFVGGKPAPLFREAKYTDKLHFLDVEFIDALQEDYLPGIVTNDDYPDLVARDEIVSTVSVASVLVMAGHRSQSEQYRRMAIFAERFLGSLERFKARDFHEKWQEVNVLAPMSGWTRFPAAQAWLDANARRAAA
ncbi:MAG: TAXI family TRAP transporter solute-binding subunit, partial [Hyphomicrobiales bacterium]|nr:TAXI family TRAP transporter solute-binding subunit [Hyphomicrobiales bacterium]